MYLDTVAKELQVFETHEDSEFYIPVFKQFYVKLPCKMKWSEIHEMLEEYQEYHEFNNIKHLTPEPVKLAGNHPDHELETDMLHCVWKGSVIVGETEDPKSSFEFDLKSFIRDLENFTGHHR